MSEAVEGIMHEYIPYDVSLEERITTDRELRGLIDAVCATAAVAWNRRRHRVLERIDRKLARFGADIVRRNARMSQA